MCKKSNYQNLKEEIVKIREELVKAENLLKQQEENYTDLVYKKEELLKRTSQLAKELLSDICKEIRELEMKIQFTKKKLSRIQGTLQDYEKQIKELEKDLKMYIEEQSTFLVDVLKNYISNNELVLGRNIETWFCIEYEEKQLNETKRKVSYPTGIVKIKLGNETIAETKEFYFTDLLYKVDNKDTFVSVEYTEWFKKYMEIFDKKIKEKFAESFKDNQNFKVTFTSIGQLILELK